MTRQPTPANILDAVLVADMAPDRTALRTRLRWDYSPATGHTLTVHHLDIDPSNCAWWNLAPLCQRCHLQIQAKVVMERQWFLPHSEWFKPYVAGYYAALNGLPDDREYVLAHVDDLIAIGQGYLEEL